jgi:hypothetical protein
MLGCPQRDDFRWRGRYYHLTYAGHIPAQMLLALLAAMSGVRVIGTSIVHEASDAECPYDHTHFAWMWERAVDLKGSRIMDVILQFGTAPIHPNIESKKSIAWMQRVFTEYHHGVKAMVAGARKIVAPVGGPWQKVPAEFEWQEFLTTQVAGSSDLLAGVHAAGVQIRSVSDVMLLQKHKRPPPFEHNFTRDMFKPVMLPASYASGSVGTLHIWGPINLGKTEWACAQFDNPLYVTTRDALRGFVPNFHDGIVIDKMLFNQWTVTDCESLTDYTQPATVSVRHGDAKIPKRTRKIIVTNTADAWPADPHGQIRGRRVAELQVVAKMY